MRPLSLCLLASGCWLAIQDPTTTYSNATGRCIPKERVGRSVRYFHDGEELSSAGVEHLLLRVPEERKSAVVAGRLRRAGWSSLAIGATFLIAGMATLLALAVDHPRDDLPTWGKAAGGSLAGAALPTLLTGAILTGQASLKLRGAVDRVNARGVCP